MYSFNFLGIQVIIYEKGKVLFFEESQFLRCRYKDKYYNFFKFRDEEWKPFLGILLSEKNTFDKGMIINHIIEDQETDETKKISFLFGGGKWIESHGRGSFLNFDPVITDNIILDINKFIKSKYLNYLRRHYSGLYYFTDSKKNYDLLEFKKINLKNLKKLDDTIRGKKLDEFKKILISNQNLEEIGYNGKRLIVYLVQNKNYSDYLEYMFQLNPSLASFLEFYMTVNNRELIIKYNLIHYYFTNEFRFDNYLKENIKYLKNVSLGKVKKLVDGKIVFMEINLLDIILLSKSENLLDIMNSNKKLFTNKETIKLIKEKKNISNEGIVNFILRSK